MEGLIRRRSSRLDKRRGPVIAPLTGDIEIKSRLTAIAEGIKLSLRKKSSVKYSNFDPSFKDDKSLDVIVDILCKPNRSNLDTNIIYIYLTQLKKMMELLSKDQNQNTESLIYKVSLALKHQYIGANKMLFRYGDKGEYFYILLKGKIEILVPTEVKVMMTDHEYIKYILMLKRNDEIELANRVVQKNHNVFTINHELLDNLLKQDKKSIFHKKSIIFNQLSKDIEETISTINTRKSRTDIVDIPVTVEDYIKSTTPFIENDNPELEFFKRQVIIYTFLHNTTLSSGSLFGENALDNSKSMRMATLITSEDTHLGVMNKKIYQECMRDIVDQDKKSNINFLISTKLFDNINKIFFQKHLYNGFALNDKITRHTKIMIEGDRPEFIYIIKEGEFEVSARKSTIQLNDMITALGENKSKTDFQFELEGNFSLTKDNPKFNKYMNEKKHTKICIVKEREILGLDDYLFDDRYSFTVECVSTKGAIVTLDRKFVNKNLLK
jgi:CRP-like cAMP-binding protein